MYMYNGELGALYSKDRTIFRLWSPAADGVYVNLYRDGDSSERFEMPEMKPLDNGVWEVEKYGNLDGVYYTYTVIIDGNEDEAVDPYAKAAGVNGKRGMVVDLALTDPPEWETDISPPFTHPTDAVIYELHIRDFSVACSSGMINKGKYLAFSEKGTKNPKGLSTGIDHLIELGITHVHLLPCFDFCTVDERHPANNEYNWGYDPENYNLPEGSYSTDPYNGHVRITELKKMVQSLHKNGIRVVMDVVYNHTYKTVDSNLNKLVPGYYYRKNDKGGFSDGSGCGNEMATERETVRKLIVDSVIYWATEYKIDGFRFDLMALYDIKTINMIRAALDEIDPAILIYGEGWTAGETPLPEEQQALKKNAFKLNERIAAFSDDMRDGIKGHIFKHKKPGFISGDSSKREDVMFGITASCFHPQVDYSKLVYSDAPWAKEPSQTVNYASAHDNLTLWDKLEKSRPDLSGTEYIKMNKLSALLILTSQGIPFIHAGEEFARTKYGEENSYNLPDKINSLEWSRKAEYKDLFEYYKGLIALRKAYRLFRLRTAADIKNSISFLPTEQHLLVYEIKNSGQIFIIAINAENSEQIVMLPTAGWDILVDGKQAGTTAIGRINDNKLVLPPRTGYVLCKL